MSNITIETHSLEFKRKLNLYIKLKLMDSSSDLENENLIKSNCDNSYLSESSDNLTDYSSETSTLKKVTTYFNQSDKI